MIQQAFTYLLCCAAAVAAAALPLEAKSKPTADKVETWSAESRKAGYYFIESQLALARNEPATAFELAKRALELDSSISIAKYHVGYTKLYLAESDSTQTEAFNLMKSHIMKHPDDIAEARTYASLNAKLGRFDEAERAYRRILQFHPRDNDVKYALARTLSMARKFPEAIEVYDSLEVSQGIIQPISVQKISLYMSLRDTANAFREAWRLYNTAPGSIDNNDILGHVYQFAGKPDSAFIYYNKMEEIDPDNVSAILNKVSYYYEIQDSVEMDRQMYRALTNENMPVEQKIEELTRYIRTMYQDRDSSERVINLFDVILAQHPHEAAIRRLYSAYLIDKKDFPAAAEQLSYALDIEPTNVDDWKNLMVLYVMSKNYPKALNAAEKALEFNNNDESLLTYIPVIYVQSEQFDKAIQMCDSTLARADSMSTKFKSDMLCVKGDVLHAKGDTISAFASYQQALKLNPKNASALNNYAYFLSLSSQELDKAEQMSAEAILLEPENASFLDTYAWISFKKRNLDTALQYIERAIKAAREITPELLEHYGDILFFTGKPDEALTQWEKALDMEPDNEILQRKVNTKSYIYDK